MESFGARLKRERERQSITLDSVAAATKIGTRLLQALEEEHFDRLPGGIFNKGFVRAYARHLGLDEEQAIADYLAAAGGAPPVKEPEAVVAALAAHAVETRAEKQSTDSGGIPWGWIAILLLMVAIGFALWSSHSRKSQKRSQDSSLPARPPASLSGPASSHGHPQASAPETSAPDAAQAPAPAATPGSFLVLVQAREDSWLSLTVDGKEIANQLLPAQSEKSIAAHQKIVIKTGNAGGLDFSFNGKRLPVQGGQNEVKTLTFDAGGLESSAAKVRQTAPVPSQP